MIGYDLSDAFLKTSYGNLKLRNILVVPKLEKNNLY